MLYEVITRETGSGWKIQRLGIRLIGAIIPSVLEGIIAILDWASGEKFDIRFFIQMIRDKVAILGEQQEYIEFIDCGRATIHGGIQEWLNAVAYNNISLAPSSLPNLLLNRLQRIYAPLLKEVRFSSNVDSSTGNSYNFV